VREVVMKVWIAGGSVYVDPTDLRGEAFWIDSYGRIGIDRDQDGRITWCAVRRDILVPVEIAPPTAEQVALLHLVSFGLAGEPGRH
jgi:hypothetical protein